MKDFTDFYLLKPNILRYTEFQPAFHFRGVASRTEVGFLYNKLVTELELRWIVIQNICERAGNMLPTWELGGGGGHSSSTISWK